MKKLLLSCLCVLFPLFLVAEQTFAERMNHIFQHVDKSQIPTGLLSDWGLHLVEPYVFDGVPGDSNFVDMDTWRMLYFGMAVSQVNNNIAVIHPDTVFDRIDNAVHPSAVPLAMMHFRYNSLNEDSPYWIVDTIIEQIFEAPGATVESLYLTQHLFAVAPKELMFEGGRASFVFDPNLWFYNTNKTIQRKEINFNNESGWLLANWNIPISHTFGSSGIKTIFFRLTYTDGTYYVSQTNVFVNRGLFRAPAADNDTLFLYAVVQGNHLHSGGTIQYRFAPDNHTGEFRRPLIVAEGFDPGYIMGGNTYLRHFIQAGRFGTVNVPYFVGPGRLLNDLEHADYDIIFLDYNNGVDCIWRNAALFRYVIEWVNARRALDADQNVVMGISMGGLVARIALRQMELDGVDHQTQMYISMDAPHKGANIPLGLQAAIRHIGGIEVLLELPGTIIPIPIYRMQRRNEDLRNAVRLLNSTAARQMLVYYVYTMTPFPIVGNSTHQAFMQQYNTLGFPQQTQNIAIANGSNRGNNDLVFPPSTPLLHFQESTRFSEWWANLLVWLASPLALLTNYPQLALNVIPGRSDFRADFRVNALPDRQVSEIYRGRIYIRKRILWVRAWTVNINLENVRVNSTRDMLPLDGAPGGLYSIDAMGMQMPDILGDNAVRQTEFSFIPTVSALALPNWQANLTQPLTPAILNTSPFTSTFVPSNNELHTRFNSSAIFLRNHLVSGMSGPDVICAEGVFTLDRAEAISWSVTDGFTITHSNYHSATVVATRLDGQTGVLTATIEGATLRRDIQACIWDWNNTKISGPPTISPATNCEATFIINNLPTGVTDIAWNSSHGLREITRTTTPQHTATFERVPDAHSLNATISFSFSINEVPFSLSKTIQTSPMPPSPSVIDVQTHQQVFNLQTGRHYYFLAQHDGGFTNFLNYQWTLRPVSPPRSNQYFTGQSTHNTPFSPVRTGVYALDLRVNDGCGWVSGPGMLFSVSDPLPPPPPPPFCFNCFGVGCFICQPSPAPCLCLTDPCTCMIAWGAIHPNPVDNVLTIDLSQQETNVFRARGTSEPIFDVRLLNSHGVLVRQQQATHGTIQFDVSRLPEGTYYLHIEHNGEIQKHQIIVNRN